MKLALIILSVALTLLLGLVSFVQLLYLESLRLRAREQPALEYFKQILEDRLGLKPEPGLLSFSLVKHLSMVLIGLAVGATAIGRESMSWQPLAEAAAFGSFLVLLSAYLVPQLLYRATSGKWLAPLAPGLKLMALLMRPLTATFVFLEKLASLNAEPGEKMENGNASEDLEALIEAGADEGLIEEDDRKLIQSVVELGDKTAREVMTPRPNVVAIQADKTIEEFRELVIHNHFSRIPVYEDSIDNIIGFAHVRDIVSLEYEERTVRRVREFVHPTCFVPETKPVTELFREMQRASIQMAIVVDEYGETAGIATMEDMVEEVFGEIRDEYDPTAGVREESEGVYLLPGSIDLDQLNDFLGFRPDEETESTTVGGLVTEWLGHVPKVGEVVERDGIRIEVTASDERHVKQVRVSRGANGGKQPDEGENGGR